MARLEELTPGPVVEGVRVAAGDSRAGAVARHLGGHAHLSLLRRQPWRAVALPRRRGPSRVESASQTWLSPPTAPSSARQRARHIQLAYLFDPPLAVRTSNFMRLPHEIAAVYEAVIAEASGRSVGIIGSGVAKEQPAALADALTGLQ